MLLDTLSKIFTRDLEKLKKEMLAYPKEELLWVTDKAILNSGGNLCLHLIGNLRTFIGGALGNSGYIRQRELEFSQKNVPVSQLIEMIETTIVEVQNTLSLLTEEDLQKEYTFRVFDHPMTTEFFLVHLSTHLMYHLGQVNYHRRLLAS